MTPSDAVALVTGAAQRLGAATAEHLHTRGLRVIIHCRSHGAEADALAAKLNLQRPDSATVMQADLTEPDAINKLAINACAYWQRLDVLVNNASVFYPTPTESASLEDWDVIMHSNLRAPFLLGQACVPALRQSKGCIINLIDIYAERPLADHPLYCASKAGLAMLTRSWARDLGPDIRANGVSPGAIMWPEQDDAVTLDYQDRIVNATSLKRTGNAQDIASAIGYLACDAPYVTGQILAVDGGRSLNI
ncbi:pteridine reductase [Marinobacter sp. BGYM27]|uniref:pteridine reductase n=1 Tax=Marinobacter sp. BGYM27 TaxID=2975597 RepID=UPI0021A4B182|nr:pteridine reductase [Marinobacter sp. BGYM27]MDG5500740.1 pteridine reductase [Marinobacter sp. BGYM27]